MMEPTPQSAAGQLYEAFKTLKRQSSQFKPDGPIRPSEYYLLLTISQCCHQPEHREGVRVSDLSRAMHHSMPAVSQSLRSLVEMGLVERSRVHQDRRTVLICTTEEGERMLEQVGYSFWTLLEEISRRLGEEDAHLLTQQINRLSEILEQMLSEQSKRKE